MTDYELPIRVATPDDWEAICRLMFEAFHNAYDEEAVEIERGTAELDRALVITDGAQVVAHAQVVSRDLTVPGKVIPAGHVTGVAVAPTHRRRGLLTRMMHRQLREVHQAGQEPVMVLWASEPQIYPRFGYGLAAQRLVLEIRSRQTQIRRTGSISEGRLRAAEPAALLPELTKVFEQLRSDRPGWSSRDERWWRQRIADTKGRRGDATELRAVVHETSVGADGYALWRTKGDWAGSSPRSEVHVIEAVATNPTSYRALWEFLLGIDLTRVARFGYAAVDEPLLYLVDDVRALGPGLTDSLWLRVVDVGTALAARRYLAGIDLVIEIADPVLPENTGRWRLIGDATTASCTRTNDPADLSCSVTDLGAVYLGGTSWNALAAAGRVREHRPGMLAAASLAFRWHRAPNGIELF